MATLYRPSCVHSYALWLGFTGWIMCVVFAQDVQVCFKHSMPYMPSDWGRVCHK